VAIVHVQRLTLENDALREELEHARNVARLPTVARDRGTADTIRTGS
jgi:hypothetical protein